MIELSDTHMRSWRWQRDGLLSAVSAGMFLLLVGAIIVATPGLVDKIVYYFQHFAFVSEKFLGIDFSLPAPEQPANPNNLAVYNATFQFCVAWGIFQVILLALRYFLGSPVRRKAQTISDIVFWFGTAYIIQTMLNITSLTPEKWFLFWAILVVVIGLSLVVRAIYLAIMWPLSHRHMYASPSAT
jgi:hypothetical protein